MLKNQLSQQDLLRAGRTKVMNQSVCNPKGKNLSFFPFIYSLDCSKLKAKLSPKVIFLKATLTKLSHNIVGSVPKWLKSAACNQLLYAAILWMLDKAMVSLNDICVHLCMILDFSAVGIHAISHTVSTHTHTNTHSLILKIATKNADQGVTVQNLLSLT